MPWLPGSISQDLVSLESVLPQFLCLEGVHEMVHASWYLYSLKLVFVCACVCMHTCLCVCKGTHGRVYRCIWRPEVDIRHLSQSLFYLFLKIYLLLSYTCGCLFYLFLFYKQKKCFACMSVCLCEFV